MAPITGASCKHSQGSCQVPVSTVGDGSLSPTSRDGWQDHGLRPHQIHGPRRCLGCFSQWECPGNTGNKCLHARGPRLASLSLHMEPAQRRQELQGRSFWRGEEGGHSRNPRVWTVGLLTRSPWWARGLWSGPRGISWEDWLYRLKGQGPGAAESPLPPLPATYIPRLCRNRCIQAIGSHKEQNEEGPQKRHMRECAGQ